MIAQALECIADDINSHLQRVQRDHLERVILSNLVDQEGNPPLDTENKIVLALTALDEEKNVYDSSAVTRGNPSVPRVTDPIYLNLHVMFAATHKHYPTGLENLSAVIGYIKGKPSLDRRNTPLLPDGIRQLYFNMEKLGYAEMSNLWSFLGANYLPAANYTIRMVGVGQRQVQTLVPAVESVGLAP
jgi:hypothetical protein